MRTRPENPADHLAVRQLHQAAFGRDVEADLVETLRREASAVLSLVAEEEGRILGHVMFSRMQAPFRALGLDQVRSDPAMTGKEGCTPQSSPRRKSGSSFGSPKMKLDSGFRRNDDEKEEQFPIALSSGMVLCYRR